MRFPVRNGDYIMKKKDDEKRQKVENVRKRKELKELNKTLIHKKVKRIKPNSSNRQNREAKENYDAEKERIKCSLCEDDLYSDTEEDSEKILVAIIVLGGIIYVARNLLRVHTMKLQLETLHVMCVNKREQKSASREMRPLKLQ